ncbi:MAG: hypothetical protein PHP86_14575 [Nevskiales bacterium]|nr:hypothetical protein [Nevskiales bacterium]
MADFSFAEEVLKSWGADVQAIPTSSKDESDWLACLDGFRLLVEEKTKVESPENIAARLAALDRGEVHGSVSALTPNNRISGIFTKAAKQLRSTGVDVAHDARVVWFTSTGFNREVKDHQAFNTIYGCTKAFDLDVSASLRDCYFRYNSTFFRHQDLDGAVLLKAENGTGVIRLCLNPYGKNWQALRDSPFALKLVNGLVDPMAQEADGQVMIVDTDIDRREVQELLAYLSKKYGIHRLQFMDMNIATAVVSVPNDR